MKKTHIAYLSAIAVLCLLGGGLFFSDYFTHSPSFEFPEELEEHISAYTAGEISRQSPIQVRFAEDQIEEEKVGTQVTAFQFRPRISGQAKWVDTRTLAFFPESLLPSGQKYEASLKLSPWIEDLPASAKKLHFRFGTRHQSFDVALTKTEVLRSQQQQWHQLQGVVRTVDIEEGAKVEKLFSAYQKNNPVPVRWEHKPKERTHHFVIDSLPRKEESYVVKMAWNGNEIGVEEKGEQEVLIPPTGKFRHLHTYAYQEPDQYVVVEFSDPLNTEQKSRGPGAD